MLTQFIAICPHCGWQMKASPEQVGAKARCNGCRQIFRITAAPLPHEEPAEDQPAAGGETQASASANTDSAIVPTVEVVPAAAASLGTLGRFVLRQLLGQGAFGRVYRAHDPQLDRFVALKVPMFGPHDKDKIQRFLLEAKTAARLRHPNIVPTYDSGQVDEKYFIASQFVPGQPLSRRIKDDPPSFRQAAEWTRQLAGALDYAHSEGIIHRDIKPDNIMLDEKGVPQIMDFGLAKRLNEDSGMTTDGVILGTPAFMAPEQARGDVTLVGPASDQYSLGVVLYEMLTGKRPFEGPPHAIIAQVLAAEPPVPRALRPDVPADLAAICQKAMSKLPANRYANTGDMAADLHRWLCGEVTLARPISAGERAWRWCSRNWSKLALAGMLLLVAALGAAVVSLWPSAQHSPAGFDPPGLADTSPVPPAQAADPIELPPESTAASVSGEATISKTEQEATPLVQPPAAAVADAPPPPSATPTAEQIAQQRAGADSKYRDQLTEARRLWLDQQFAKAAAELENCDAQQRGWEWRLWMARAHGGDALTYTRCPGQPERLRFSSDGEFLLAGGLRGSTPWNAIYSLAGGKRDSWRELPATDAENACGQVCAFSRDGKHILTVQNQPARDRAFPHLWDWSDSARPPATPRSGGELPGFALDCGQAANDHWLVLTASIVHASGGAGTRLQPPLVVHNLNTKEKHSFEMDEIYAAAFDAEMTTLHVLARRGIENYWDLYDLSGMGQQSHPVAARFVAADPRAGADLPRLPAWRPSSTRNMVFTGSSLESPTGLMMVDGAVFREIELPAGPLAATFDARGSRLIVARGDVGSLHVFDPASPSPNRSFPPVRLVGASGSTAATVLVELSPPNGQISDKLVVAIDDTLTIFDLSGGR